MKKLQLSVILGLVLGAQACAMDDAGLKRGKDTGTININWDDSGVPDWSQQRAALSAKPAAAQPVPAQAVQYTNIDPKRAKDMGGMHIDWNDSGVPDWSQVRAALSAAPAATPAPTYPNLDAKRTKDYGVIQVDQATVAPAAAQPVIRYNKPLPTPPAKKAAAAAVVLSTANQQLVDHLVAKLTELGVKINSLNDKIPAVAGTVRSGDVSQYLDPKFIKTGFWTAVRGGEALLLTNKIRKDVEKLNQTDAATKQVAKEKVTPVLTSAAFTTAINNLQAQLDKLPEPLSSEAKSLIDVTRFLKAQFNIK